MSKLAKLLGLNIEKIRVERDWSQTELAYNVGIPQQTISIYINGKANVTFSTVEKIAAKLGIEDPSELFRPGLTLNKPQDEIKPQNLRGVDDSVLDKLGARKSIVQTDQDAENERPGGTALEKNLHSLSSEIAKQVITALEPRLLPADLSKEKRDLIAVILNISEPKVVNSFLDHITRVIAGNQRKTLSRTSDKS